jgi:hypothetical protein
MQFLYGLSILVGGVCAILGVGTLLMLFNLKSGDGSQLTAFAILGPIALTVAWGLLWFGLNGFDLLPTFDVGAALRGQ